MLSVLFNLVLEHPFGAGIGVLLMFLVYGVWKTHRAEEEAQKARAAEARARIEKHLAESRGAVAVAEKDIEHAAVREQDAQAAGQAATNDQKRQEGILARIAAKYRSVKK